MGVFSMRIGIRLLSAIKFTPIPNFHISLSTSSNNKSNKKTRLYRRVEWQRPIFPGGCPPSIVGADGLNCRVRDGNECFPFAIVTTPPAYTCGWISSFLIGGDEGIRTPDLCRARAALFQLSYIPSHTSTGWAFLDSNQGPQSYQDCALTT